MLSNLFLEEDYLDEKTNEALSGFERLLNSQKKIHYLVSLILMIKNIQ